MSRFKQKLITARCFGFFALYAVFCAIPKAWIYSLLWPHDETRKLQYHEWFCRKFRWMSQHIEGVSVAVRNKYGETFDRPSIIIANHESHLDLLCLIMLHPRVVAMTNRWVWNFPLYAPVIRYLEYYPATEGLDNNQQHIADLLHRGYSVIIFPEGTRSAECRILKFHRGAFYLAEQLGVDIVPVYLHGCGKVLPKNDFCVQSGIIDVEIGRRIDVSDTSMGSNYREKTRLWHQHYLKHFGQA